MSVATTLAELVAKRNVQLSYIAILKPYDVAGASALTLYYSDSGFVTGPSDTPANQFFDPRLVEPITFSRTMFSSGRVGGFSRPGYGNLILSNGDGELDDFAGYAWDSREVEVRVGEFGAGFSNFFTIFKGESKTIEFDDETVEVVLRDNQEDFEIEFPPNVYTDVSLSDNILGKPIPLCFGEVRNIEPVLIDSTNRVYQVNDGEINAVSAVYEGGVALTLTTDYTVDLTNGKITLVAAPTGIITADIQGYVDSGSTYLTSAADIAREIVTTFGGLADPGDLDTASLTALNTANNSTVGIYVEKSTTILKVLDELANSVGAFYGFNRAGKFEMARLELASGTADADFDLTNIIEVQRQSSATPNHRVRVGYDKNYKVMSESDFGSSVTTAQRDYLVRDMLFESDNTASIRTIYPNSEELVIEALFAASSAASTEATRLLALYGSQRDFYKIRVKTQPYTLKLNDVVQIAFDRYNLTSGKKFRVITITEDAASNEVELELWG